MSELKFKFKMPDDESLAGYISVKGEKGDKGDPTKLSELENDTGFVTADTSSLTNYYTKAQTDSAIGANVTALKNELGVPDGFFTDTSETVTGSGQTITLANTAYAVFKDIKLYGDTEQDGTPTPESPVEVQTVTGNQTVIITDGDQQSQSYTITLGNIELCKLGNNSDYIYKDGSKWYVHREIGKKIFDGTTYVQYYDAPSASVASDAATAYFEVYGLDNAINGVNLKSPEFGTPYDTLSKLWGRSYDTAEDLTQSGIGAQNNTLRVRISKLCLDDWDDTLGATAKANIFKSWLESNPITIYYPLSAATEEEITNSILVKQLEIVSFAKSYESQTSITANGSLSAILSLAAFRNNWNGTISGINNQLDGTISGINNQLGQKLYYFDTVAAMKSYNLAAGDTAQTLGYRSINDGGAGTYRIISSEATADGGSLIELNNGLMAQLIVENDEVNVKQFGSYGDGSHDDSSFISAACAKFKNILIPEGTYKLNSTVSLSQNTNIYGKTAIVCWSGNTDNSKKTEIVTTDVYAFTCSWGKVNNFANLSFDGYGIDQPCGARINKCEFNGTLGLNHVRVSTISECSFHHCSTAGIKRLTDSFVQNCFFYYNEIAIDMESSGDNTILGNKIEWNELGIKLQDTVYAIIANNTFDRQTTYAISGANSTNININGNIFERNLTCHIKLSGSGITISNNHLLAKNSEDDQSGTLQPTIALDTPSISNTMIMNNYVTLPSGSNTSKLFKEYPDYVSNVRIEGNTLNGLNTDKFTVNLGKLTSSTSASTSLTYNLSSNLNYLGLNVWMIKLALPRLESSNVIRSFTN